MSTTLVYKAYAKINLYLDVLGKRRDGYHNIETIFQSVSLADEIVFSERNVRISMACSDPDLDTGEQNLVVRAARLLRERSGHRTGVRIYLDKRIPMAAGLGGGSSDAATTLIALNHLWELHWPGARLEQLARELGADVAFCVRGGTAVGTLRGEMLSPLPPLPETWFVLIHPDVTVSTTRAYNSPLLGASAEQAFAGRTPSLRRALRALEAGDLPAVLYNRMEEAVFATRPQLAEIKQWLLEQGCPAAAMSGSGATIMGLCRSREQAHHVAAQSPKHPASVVCPVPTCAERIQ